METKVRWNSFQNRSEKGFTRVDLIASCVILALLTLSAAPLWGIGKAESDSAICFNNNKTLIKAWQLFAMDNSDKLAAAIHGGIANQSSPTPLTQLRSPVTGQLAFAWAQGWQTWDLSGQNTNDLSFIDARYGALAQYIGRRPEVFKCPADTYLSAAQQAAGWKARARSYSMSITIGDGNGGPGDGPCCRLCAGASAVWSAPAGPFPA